MTTNEPVSGLQKTSHYISLDSLRIRIGHAFTSALSRSRVRRRALRRLEIYARRHAHRQPDAM